MEPDGSYVIRRLRLTRLLGWPTGLAVNLEQILQSARRWRAWGPAAGYRRSLPPGCASPCLPDQPVQLPCHCLYAIVGPTEQTNPGPWRKCHLPQ